MVQLGQRQGFIAELSAGSIVAEGTRRQDLERHITLKLLIAGAIDHAHSTGAHLFQDAVMAECLANHAEGTYPCGHLRLRRGRSQRCEADLLARFQSIMKDQELTWNCGKRRGSERRRLQRWLDELLGKSGESANYSEHFYDS